MTQREICSAYVKSQQYKTGWSLRLLLNWHRGTAYCAYVSNNAAWTQREYRRLRALNGWSQDYADRVAIYLTYISDLERAARNPKIKDIEKLA